MSGLFAPMAVTGDALAIPVADRTRRHIRRRLLPYLFVLYAIAYLDRVNVSYAALQMSGDLGFTPEVYGFGAGIFFVGYLILEIPGTILVEKWSARRWIARIMISWGIVAACTGFIHTATQFHWMRFLLGVAEAGFFPGIIVYLSHWIRYEERATALAGFMLAQPIASVVGSPVSGFLLGIHWFGLAGWRWLFILEGIPAALFGVVTLFYLTDWPSEANWLADDERDWITSELEREKQARRHLHPQSAWRTLPRREVLQLCIAYFCVNCSVYGLAFWLPTIVKKLSGFSNFTVSAIAALPYCVGLLAMVLISRSSDRKSERRWHTALSLGLISLGLTLSAVPSGVILPLLMFCVAAAGMYGYLPSFWSIATGFLTGTAAAAAVGFINSVGNLGGFAGPFIVGYLVKRTHSFVAGVVYLASCSALAAVLVLLVRPGKQTPAVPAELPK
jgi:MFS transporter, ACS family, tartrate transporter